MDNSAGLTKPAHILFAVSTFIKDNHEGFVDVANNLLGTKMENSARESLYDKAAAQMLQS